MNNKKVIFHNIFNAPYKKCIITKSYYPFLLMQKFAKIENSFEGYTYIPDSMYSDYDKSDYIFCSEEILTSELNKTKYPSNFIELILEDIKYCNRILLRKLLNKFEICEISNLYKINSISDSIVIHNNRIETQVVNFGKCLFKFDLKYFSPLEEGILFIKEFLLKLFEEEIDLFHSNLIKLHEENKIRLTHELFFFEAFYTREKFESNSEQRIKILCELIKEFISNRSDIRKDFENLIQKDEILNLIDNYQKVSEISSEKNFVFIYQKRLDSERENILNYFLILISNVLKYNKLVDKKYFL